MKFLSIFAFFKFLLERFNLILRFSLQVAFIFLETIWLISNTWRFIRLWDLLSCIVTMIGSNFVKHFNKTERENLSSSSSIHCTAKKNVQRSFSAIFRFLFFNQAKLPFMLDCRSYVLTSNVQRLIKSIDCNIGNKKGKSFHSLNSINLLIQAPSEVFVTLILIKHSFIQTEGKIGSWLLSQSFNFWFPFFLNISDFYLC